MRSESRDDGEGRSKFRNDVRENGLAKLFNQICIKKVYIFLDYINQIGRINANMRREAFSCLA